MTEASHESTDAPNSETSVRSLVALFLIAFLTVAIVLVSWRILAVKIQEVVFIGDETVWITGGLYYTELVKRGDITQEKWDARDFLSAGGGNMPLGKYIMGAGLRLHSGTLPEDLEFRGIYNFSQSVPWNNEHGKIPPPGLLYRARQVNLIVAIACFLVFFGVVTTYANVYIAALAAYLVVFNAWIAQCYAWALTDTTYNLFLLLSLWAGVLYLKSNTRARTLSAAAICGLLGGMACSVKITGIAITGIAFLLIVGIRLCAQRERSLEYLLAVLVFGSVATALVYAINPFFWPTSSWSDVLELPRLYGRTKATFDSVPIDARLWPEDSNRLIEIHRMLFLGYAIVPFEWAAFLLGIGFSVRRLLRSIKSSEVAIAAVPLAYFLANYLFLLAFMGLNYPRHYIAAVFSVKIITAIGAVEGARIAVAALRKASENRRAQAT